MACRMNLINSQYITEPLTHLTPEDGYIGMKKNGIKLVDRGKDGLIYKPPGFFISMKSITTITPISLNFNWRVISLTASMLTFKAVVS